MSSEVRLPTIHTAGLAAAESTLNAALKLSPHSVEALKDLADQVLALECTKPALTLFLRADLKGYLHLAGAHEADVTTRVRGTAEDFAALAGTQDPAAELINGNLELNGSSATLTDMQRIFADLDLDWEAPIVDALGDVAGHQLASMLRASFSWSQQASTNLQRQLGEFALEEARLTPPALALEDYYSDVQQLAERSDRLAARIERLRQRIERLRLA